MKEHPLIYSAWSVQRILAGTKTMTRRPNPERFRSWLVGDRIWCRETWQYMGDDIAYKATEDWELLKGQWKPSIYMHRHESRILLEITALRIEPLQDITWPDCGNEGIEYLTGSMIDKFALLWDSINAKRGFSWDSNPPVIVIGFKVLSTEREA